MPPDVRECALRLLRLMNEQQAKGRTDVAVGPEPHLVEQADIEDSEHLEAVMTWLLTEGALDPRPDRGGIVGDPDYGISFNITERGLSMLR